MPTESNAFRKLLYPLALVVVFSTVLQVATDTDTWWHLSAGKWMLEHRSFMTHDPFSYTKSGEEWVHTGAPFQVALYLIYRAAGFGGINLLAASVITLAFAVIWHVLDGGLIVRSTAVICGAMIAAIYGAARPHLLSLVFIAGCLWFFEGFRKGSKIGYPGFPLLMFLWANSHAGFWMGFILLGVYGLESILETDRSGGWREWLRAIICGRPGKMALSGLLALLCTLANPFTWRIYEAVADTFVRKAETLYIGEWQSPNFHDPAVYPLLAGILGTILLLAISRRPKRVSHMLLALGMVLMSLYSVRHLAMFAIVMPVVWAGSLSALEQDVQIAQAISEVELKTGQRRVLTASSLFVIGFLLVAGLLQFLGPLPTRSAIESYYPTETLNYLLDEKPAGRLFSSYNWGGYLSWNLPQYPVYIDGRTDLFRDELFMKWLQVIQANEGWEEELDRWGVCTVLIEPGRPIAKVLPLSGWQEVARDANSVLFTRRCAAISE